MRGLKRQGIRDVYLSIEADTKAFPAIVITTTETEPLHPNAVVSKYTVEVAIIGPAASQDDKDSETSQHVNLNRNLARKLSNLMPNKTLDDRWNLFNCVEIEPGITTNNEKQYWMSGYTLSFI